MPTTYRYRVYLDSVKNKNAERFKSTKIPFSDINEATLQKIKDDLVKWSCGYTRLLQMEKEGKISSTKLNDIIIHHRKFDQKILSVHANAIQEAREQSRDSLRKESDLQYKELTKAATCKCGREVAA